VHNGRQIRGILFDAGGVLIRPIGGRWNPRYDFESIVFIDDDSDLVSAAVDLGYHGIAIAREEHQPIADDTIRTLDELLPIAAGQ
jgi:FMN phosphatase YigB (HAD superfamily)